MIKSAPFSTRRSPTKSTFHLSPPTHSDAYEDHDFSEEDEDFEFDSDITEFFFLFFFLTCRDETKRQKGRSGNVHLYFTRAGRLIETVSSKALSRFPRFHVSTIRKCYQLLGTPESPRLIPVGDTSSPFPCEYIKIPAYTTSPRLTPVPFRSRGHGPSRITFLRPRSSAF